jgi:hypothetical protein
VIATTIATKTASPSRAGQMPNAFGGGGAFCAAAALAAIDAAVADAGTIDAETLQAAENVAPEQTAARDCCVPSTLKETSGSMPLTLVGVGAA